MITLKKYQKSPIIQKESNRIQDKKFSIKKRVIVILRYINSMGIEQLRIPDFYDETIYTKNSIDTGLLKFKFDSEDNLLVTPYWSEYQQREQLSCAYKNILLIIKGIKENKDPQKYFKYMVTII